MKKDLGNVSGLYPMPVLMIATYGEDGKVDVMNAAWGVMCDPDKIALSLTDSHKTVKNILKSKAFTVAPADVKNLEAADFFGIASGNTMKDKFERTGYTAVKSKFVNAPVIEEFPVVMECEFLEKVVTDNVNFIVGRIVNTAADERVMTNGKIDPEKLEAISFDTFGFGYYATGKKVGTAWSSGKKLMK